MNPIISIIVPVFNSENHIKTSIKNILNQTLKNIEIICINDGSTDNSLKILKKLKNTDNRIRIINQKNLGAAVARNNGINLAKGKYLSILDADDEFDLDMLETMYIQAEKTNADIVVCPFRYTTDLPSIKRGVTIPKILNSLDSFNFKNIPDKIFQITAPNPWSKLFRKDFILENEIKFQNLKSCNDMYFTYVSLALAKNITLLNKSFVAYRQESPGSITSKRGNNYENIFLANQAIVDFLKNKDIYQYVNKSFVARALTSLNYEIQFIDNSNINIFIEKMQKLINNF